MTYLEIDKVISDIAEEKCADAKSRLDAVSKENTTERKAIIQARVGQGSFRKALIEKYHGTCLITGINLPKLLVASHIKPWSVSSNAERLSVDNGLLLSATYDRLFDSGLITFDKSGKIYISSLVCDDNMARLRLTRDVRYDIMPSTAMREFLEYHNDFLFVK